MSQLTRRPRLWTGVLVVAILTASAVLAGVVLGRTQLIHSSVKRGVSLSQLAAGHHQSPAALQSKPPLVIRDALFVGASYTQGLGATTPTDSYAYIVGREMGWQTQVDGVSGTGYLNPGPRGNQTFAERVVHLPTVPNPNLVIFQGGRNDTGYPMSKLRAAVIATIDLTRKHFRGVEIVLLGPIPAHVPVPGPQLAVEKTLRSAAAACKVAFIDPIAQGWITPENEVGYAGHVSGHPDNLGYAYIAQRLKADLKTVLTQPSQY